MATSPANAKEGSAEKQAATRAGVPPAAVRWLFPSTIFLGAFLLFLIEPLFAKLILPWFGGTAAVWAVCLVFFQSALLLGYWYADVATRRLAPKTFLLLHFALLLLSLFLLPIAPQTFWRTHAAVDPAWRILGLLTFSIGLPFVLLSSTSPLAQAWYARRAEGRSPYHLYSLSNLASLLALLSFPFFIEPRLNSHQQRILWSVIYAVFVVICACAAWVSLRSEGASSSNRAFERLANGAQSGEARPHAGETPNFPAEDAVRVASPPPDQKLRLGQAEENNLTPEARLRTHGVSASAGGQEHTPPPSTQDNAESPSPEEHALPPSTQGKAQSGGTQEHALPPSTQGKAQSGGTQEHALPPSAQDKAQSAGTQDHALPPSTQGKAQSGGTQEHALPPSAQDKAQSGGTQEHALPPSTQDRALWLGLAACGSMMLLAVTNHLSQNVSPVPLLWVVPLALYLLTFMIVFARRRLRANGSHSGGLRANGSHSGGLRSNGSRANRSDSERLGANGSHSGGLRANGSRANRSDSERLGANGSDSEGLGANGLYSRWLAVRLLAVALGGTGYAIYDYTLTHAIQVGVPLYCGALFFVCLYCHGELAQRRPAAEYLTSFYLIIAMGGAVGAVCVGLLAPHVLRGVFELPVVLIIAAALATVLHWHGHWGGRLFWCYMTGVMIAVLVYHVRATGENVVLRSRDFYAALRVQEFKEGLKLPYRLLLNGTIEHGGQFLSWPENRNPTTYYGRKSGVGLALRFCCDGPRRVGVIGLGTGTIAAYGKPGDYFRFYEIDPQVVNIANNWFTFLKQSPAKIEVTLGDARLSLENEEPQQFDVLAVDAFSGDAIPVHLLTREAFALYFRHLKPEGILAVHVSNTYLDLTPVVKLLAEDADYNYRSVLSSEDDPAMISAADWVLVTRNQQFLNIPDTFVGSRNIEVPAKLRVWTDDDNNLFQVLRSFSYVKGAGDGS